MCLTSYHRPTFTHSTQNNPLQWRHNGRDGVSNHQSSDCLLNRLLRRRSKKTLKLRVSGLCAGNSPGTGEFPAQMASNAEKVSIWWRHHAAKVLQALHLVIPAVFVSMEWPSVVQTAVGLSVWLSEECFCDLDLFFNDHSYRQTFQILPLELQRSCVTQMEEDKTYNPRLCPKSTTLQFFLII